MSTKTAADMRWHHDTRHNDGVLRHPADAEAWKNFDRNHETFALETRNVRLGLALDGFNPFGDMNVNYSIWPVKEVNCDKIMRSIANGWKVVTNNNSEGRGRIWVLWDEKIVNLQVVGVIEQSTHCVLSFPVDIGRCAIAFVYGDNEYTKRVELWDQMDTTGTIMGTTPWMILGDFNVVKSRNERWGGSNLWSSYMEDLQDSMCKAGMEGFEIFRDIFYLV